MKTPCLDFHLYIYIYICLSFIIQVLTERRCMINGKSINVSWKFWKVWKLIMSLCVCNVFWCSLCCSFSDYLLSACYETLGQQHGSSVAQKRSDARTIKGKPITVYTEVKQNDGWHCWRGNFRDSSDGSTSQGIEICIWHVHCLLQGAPHLRIISALSPSFIVLVFNVSIVPGRGRTF